MTGPTYGLESAEARALRGAMIYQFRWAVVLSGYRDGLCDFDPEDLAVARDRLDLATYEIVARRAWLCATQPQASLRVKDPNPEPSSRKPEPSVHEDDIDMFVGYEWWFLR